MKTEFSKSTLDDAGILGLIHSFEEWQIGKPSDSDGLNRMLDFIKNSLHRNTDVASALLARFGGEMASLRDYAIQLDQDVVLALDYFLKLMNEDFSRLDTDPLVSMAIYALRWPKKYLPKNETRTRYMGLLNATFGNQLHMRATTHWSVLVDGDTSKHNMNAIAQPCSRLICAANINLPLYANSMQLGNNAWGEGLDIINEIYNHMKSEDSVGQLCSLTPPGVPSPVDWRSQMWMWSPVYLEWLENSHMLDRPLPVAARQEMLRFLDQSV